MNKKQLVGKISSSMNLSKADAERQFDGITENFPDLTILANLRGIQAVHGDENHEHNHISKINKEEE